MKYKDICSLFKQRKMQVRMALRVRLCRPYVRKSIDEWLCTKREPSLTVMLSPKKENAKSIVLSAQSLIHDYGLSPLDALLFIDWANRTDKDIYKALNALVHRSAFYPTVVTEEMIKRVDKKVLEEYQKIEEQKNKRFEELEKEYKQIENCELYE